MSTSDTSPPSGPLAAMPPVSAGRIAPDGSRVYRLVAPLVMWWCWVAIAVFALADPLIQGNHKIPPSYAAGILAITGLTFACTLWPRVIADAAGLTVRNPFRSFRIPWPAVRGVFVGDSIEIQCSRQAPKSDRTIYCWALFSSRRSRAKSQLRATARERRVTAAGRTGALAQGRVGGSAPAGFGRLPAEAGELLGKGAAELIAAELRQVLEHVPGRDDATGAVRGTWAWQPLAAVLVPAGALAVLLFA
jgi:hypothetical protein